MNIPVENHMYGMYTCESMEGSEWEEKVDVSACEESEVSRGMR